ncbi:MAG: alanine racemase [Verrucomicrobiota bacterium]
MRGLKTVPPRLRAWAEIDLATLERNLHAIRVGMPPHLKTIAVVKANAYGHGIAPVVARLMRAGADAFAVANLEEAARIRELGTGWPILALSVLLPEEYRDAVRLKVRPVISSLAEVRHLSSIAAELRQPIAVHLKIDTGMGRLGVWYPEAPSLLKAILAEPGLILEGLCTHFAAADSDQDFTTLQRDRFLNILPLLPPQIRAHILLHADNSAGVHSFHPGGPFNAIRVGLLQFGVASGPQGPLERIKTKPVLSFHCRVGLVKTLPAKATLSYGMTCRLSRPSRIAVLTAGYADGLTTAFSNRGRVLIQGHLCPILGRVTMDQCLADVTDLPTIPAPGEIATFIGRSHHQELSVNDYATASGQIEWESLCAISSRTHRVYLNDSAV